MEIGSKLRLAREARGISLEQAENETKIRKKYLEALERDDFDVLPGWFYVRSFLRTYARYLGLDAEELLQHLNECVPGGVPPVEPQAAAPSVADRSNDRKLRGVLFVAIAFLVAVVLMIGFFIMSGKNGEKVPQGNGRNTIEKRSDALPGLNDGDERVRGERHLESDGSIENSVAPRSREEVELVLVVVSQRCWMQVLVDGRKEFEGTVAAGEERVFKGKEKIALRLGNAGAVKVIFNGQELGFLGRPGEVVYREFSTGSGSAF